VKLSVAVEFEQYRQIECCQTVMSRGVAVKRNLRQETLLLFHERSRTYVR